MIYNNDLKDINLLPWRKRLILLSDPELQEKLVLPLGPVVHNLNKTRLANITRIRMQWILLRNMIKYVFYF